MAIADEIQKLSPSGLVEMYEIDFTPLGGTLVRFFNGKNLRGTDLVWKGNVYVARSMEAKGFTRDAQGRVPRPTITMSNLEGSLTKYIQELGGDITGMKFTRRRTLIKYLDSANFKPVVNLVPLSDYPSKWPGGTARNVDGTLSPFGVPDQVVKTAKQVSTGSESFSIVLGAPQSGGLVLTAYLMAATSDKAQLGLRQSNQWKAGASFRVISGPGQIEGPDMIATVTGLSSEEWTRVEIVGVQFNTVDPLELYFYPDTAASTTIGAGVYVCCPQVEYGVESTPYQGNKFAIVSPNPEEDPTQEFPPEVWIIDRKSSENKQTIQFELASPFDRPGCLLPARQIMPNCCTHIYRGEGCGYTGGPVADAKDVPTTDPAKDACSHTLNGCKKRYGEDGILPFGAEPAVGAYR